MSLLFFRFLFFFFFNDPATTEIYTLSLHDALPISPGSFLAQAAPVSPADVPELMGGASCFEALQDRSEEHTSELQSPYDLVCRLLLEKKKNEKKRREYTYPQRSQQG